ncbi:MAG: sigma-54 dependent transcriptional regulator [Acidobacteriaceae bacterium]
MASTGLRAELPGRSSAGARTAVLVSADGSFRQRVREALTGLRWQVRETRGGAETLASLDAFPTETVIVDSWLPDLEIAEFLAEVRRGHPAVDVVMADASDAGGAGVRSPRRNEVLYALERAQSQQVADDPRKKPAAGEGREVRAGHSPAAPIPGPGQGPSAGPGRARAAGEPGAVGLPEFVGMDAAILEVSRRIRLVAPRHASVLIEGPTGSGKELVARALHRLSGRSARKLVALNCAAIPEALLEAELFGHTRGAFTGAVQGRTGRIEAAHGGTLLLDEIGEMPLGLQAKLLRFLETGELQRVGENEPVRVDVRIVAATHRPLRKMAEEGAFRQDLYYRLAVFLIRTPALEGRREAIAALAQMCLGRLARGEPAKGLTAGALEQLMGYPWPGNVRELEHVLERAWILAEDRPEIDVQEIEFDVLL